MAHVVESAASGRAKCRACGERIAKGALRLGEQLPNLFGEGDMTRWFHPECAAYKRPQLFLEALQAGAQGLDDQGVLEAIAKEGIAHHRLPRINGVERAPSARAHCRSCRELIERDDWRVALVYYEEGRFDPGGYIHLRCSPSYFETPDLLDRLRHFSPGLTESDVEQIRARLLTS
jgi:Poly(ADP-ribose) polymerase and DNA-Ligase Zn-finger region